MTLIAYIFPKLRTANDVVKKIYEMSCFRTPSDSHDVKGFQRLLKSAKTALLSHFLINMRETKLKNVSFSNM